MSSHDRNLQVARRAQCSRGTLSVHQGCAPHGVTVNYSNISLVFQPMPQLFEEARRESCWRYCAWCCCQGHRLCRSWCALTFGNCDSCSHLRGSISCAGLGNKVNESRGNNLVGHCCYYCLSSSHQHTIFHYRDKKPRSKSKLCATLHYLRYELVLCTRACQPSANSTKENSQQSKYYFYG